MDIRSQHIIRYPTPPPQTPTSPSENASRTSSSDDAHTLVESIPPSPPQPPAYGYERAPPQYQDETDPDNIKARRKAKRTLCIRLLTSIFITVIVSLIIAAVVARVQNSNMNTGWSSPATNKSNETSFTRTVDHAPQPVMLATESALQNVKSAFVENKADPTTISRANKTTGTVTLQTVDCASLGYFINATPLTNIIPRTTGISTPKRKRRGVQDQGEENMLVLSVYSVNGCVLARTSYKTDGDGLLHRCTMNCPHK